jgi:hypothetical protein
MWEPPVPGEYTIIATFAGTASYYGSYAETAMGVSERRAPEAIEPEPVLSASAQYEPVAPEPAEALAEVPVVTVEVAIIAVVTIACIIGVVAFLALRKRK